MLLAPRARRGLRQAPPLGSDKLSVLPPFPVAIGKTLSLSSPHSRVLLEREKYKVQKKEQRVELELCNDKNSEMAFLALFAKRGGITARGTAASRRLSGLPEPKPEIESLRRAAVPRMKRSLRQIYRHLHQERHLHQADQ